MTCQAAPTPRCHPERLLGAVLVFSLLTPFGRSADLSPEAGNPVRGKALFAQNCAVCHAAGSETVATAGQGPILGGVLGRPAGSLANFGYTKALRDSNLTWDAANLDRFLSGPGQLVPGTLMVIVIPDPADRRDLISYLATLPRVAPVAPVAEPSTAAAAADPGDWRNDAPGVRHAIRLAALPAPFATGSTGNAPGTVDRPPGNPLSVPAGFTIKLFASGLAGPRLMRTAPNGDIFVSETGAGRVRVLRTADGADAPAENRIFASNLKGPFGIAFYPAGPDPQWIYIANLNSVLRYPYRNGDLEPRGPAEIIVSKLADTTGGHTTRDIVFTPDGRRLLISVGSESNVAESMSRKSAEEIRQWESSHGFGASWDREADRADILQTDPEGRAPLRSFANGIRNPVGLAIAPATGEVWASTNERDALGDNLVPDYITHVREGGYYGWPWYYMGDHEDPRHAGERPDLAGRAIVPDVPVQPHSASLQITFYPAVSGVAAFPAEYRGNIFAAFHGSWNRATRTGTKVVRVLFKDGVPTGEYEDFLTGFTVDNHHVWGRPVGVTVARDGALLVTDDVGGTLWRIAYTGAKP